MIVAIVLIVLLVLGGGGVAVWVLTKNNGDSKDASDDKKTDQSSSPSSEDQTTDQSQEPTGDTDAGGDAVNTPDDVRDAYMEAYETKSFSSVVDSACAAYKSKYGTDTSSLEKTLEPYDITASASGDPDVNGNTATANIDLQLTQAGTTERPSIFIKIVEEDGEWRFCGEGEG
ncbi:MAG TPA: hypothetical protein VGP26_14130 [Actinophytocola sp.]|nr:hypothetical protein [Actinophytocola sp.]